MKLLGWISCKLRSINPAPLKDSGTGNPSRLSLNPSWKEQKDRTRPRSGNGRVMQPFYEFDKAKEEEEEYGEEKDDIFPGFLSIGTLNMDSMATEPPTPTFGLPSDQEDNTEETISDMKLINNELEKFLKMEAEGFGESRRTSEASTISLSGVESDVEAKAFPLQGYLFASSYDVAASKGEAKIEKGTLLELFRRSRDGDNYSYAKIERQKEDEGVRKQKGPTMRRFLKPLQNSHKKNEAFKDEDSIDPSLPRKRFQKIKQLFQRKVNPEGHTAVKASNNKLNCSKKNVRNTVDSHVNGGPASSRKRSNDVKKTSYSAADRSINVEQWIRTDADYLVLELAGM